MKVEFDVVYGYVKDGQSSLIAWNCRGFGQLWYVSNDWQITYVGNLHYHCGVFHVVRFWHPEKQRQLVLFFGKCLGTIEGGLSSAGERLSIQDVQEMAFCIANT